MIFIAIIRWNVHRYQTKLAIIILSLFRATLKRLSKSANSREPWRERRWGRTTIIKFSRCLSDDVALQPGNTRYLVVSVLVGAYGVRKWMIAGKIETRADRKRAKVEADDLLSSLSLSLPLATLSLLLLTYISILYPYSRSPTVPPLPPPSTSLRRHLMVVSCREDEESATEFPSLSQIPASLASRRRRRRRWDVKSDSTTADVTNDRSRRRATPLPCKPLQRLKHRECQDIPRFEVWIESDALARRVLHSISRRREETRVSI